MSRKYRDLVFTDSVKRVQEGYGVRDMTRHQEQSPLSAERLSPREQQFIVGRDSFYVASVLENGWPYVQHRGGQRGFLKVIDERTLAFADFRGNLQYVTVGNSTNDDRVALFLMDYARKQRLKIMARLQFIDPDAEGGAELRSVVEDPGYRGKIERIAVLKVEAFDWNCPQHITPRYTEEEFRELFGEP